METALQRARRAMRQLNREEPENGGDPSNGTILTVSPHDVNDRNDQRYRCVASVAEMTVSEFAQSSLIVRVPSSVLGCDVLLVADNADPSTVEASGLAVYWAREFKPLIGMSAKDLELLHACKLHFGGELVE